MSGFIFFLIRELYAQAIFSNVPFSQIIMICRNCRVPVIFSSGFPVPTMQSNAMHHKATRRKAIQSKAMKAKPKQSKNQTKTKKRRSLPVPTTFPRTIQIIFIWFSYEFTWLSFNCIWFPKYLMLFYMMLYGFTKVLIWIWMWCLMWILIRFLMSGFVWFPCRDLHVWANCSNVLFFPRISRYLRFFPN